MKKTLFLIVLCLPAVLVAACGSIATPVPDSESLTLAAQEVDADTEAIETPEEQEVVTTQPTNTPVPPTNTPMPPTATPTEEIVEPTATEEEALSEEDQNTVLFVSRFSDPANGEALFHTSFDVMLSAGTVSPWMCSTCHNTDSEDMLVGPGLLNLASRAGERIPGVPAEVYVVNSIIHPGEYVVEGFNDGVMPTGYADVFTEQEIYDLAAYVLSLQG